VLPKVLTTFTFIVGPKVFQGFPAFIWKAASALDCLWAPPKKPLTAVRAPGFEGSLRVDDARLKATLESEANQIWPHVGNLFEALQ
jgi:hypothetical protein